jgi:hypothetical protein
MGVTMSSEILVPVDGTESTLNAARYAGVRLGITRDVEVTFLYVVELPPALLEHGGAARAELEPRKEHNLEEARRRWLDERREQLESDVFASARRALRESHADERKLRIATKVVGIEPSGDVVDALLDELAEGNYDAVVLHRRNDEDADDSPFADAAHRVVTERPDSTVWFDG